MLHTLVLDNQKTSETYCETAVGANWDVYVWNCFSCCIAWAHQQGIYWQYSLGRCSFSGFHLFLPKHSAAFLSHSQMNISHSLFPPEEEKSEWHFRTPHIRKCWMAQSLKARLVLLTATGDLLVSFIAVVVIEFGVGVVQDGPALRVLHSISVALVMHLAAPAGPKEPNGSNFYNTLTNFWSVGSRGRKMLTCPDRQRGSQSLPFHSSSRSRHSQIRANCPA